MPSAHRQIETAARIARDHASALLAVARLDGASRAEIAMLADYADEQRDRWLQAVEDSTAAVLAALDAEVGDGR